MVLLLIFLTASDFAFSLGISPAAHARVAEAWMQPYYCVSQSLLRSHES
jgi:hypothetical protein